METTCTHCNSKLAVDPSLVGREVRCPTCEYVFVVPDTNEIQRDIGSVDVANSLVDGPQVEPSLDHAGDETEAKISAAQNEQQAADAMVSIGSDESLWMVRIPEGRDFGPVNRNTLDTWVRQGRIAENCSLRRKQDSDWLPAVAIYPVLDEQGSPFARGHSNSLQQMMGHRGKLILGLAFAGCIVPFLSIGPAVMGTRDLRRMQQGKMDSSGANMTRAGQAISMVASLIWTGAFAVALLAMLIRLVSN